MRSWHHDAAYWQIDTAIVNIVLSISPPPGLISDFMDEDFRAETRWLQPFVQNHALSFEALAA